MMNQSVSMILSDVLDEQKQNCHVLMSPRGQLPHLKRPRIISNGHTPKNTFV